MSDSAEREKRLSQHVSALRNELEDLVSSCKTDEDLKIIMGAVAMTNTYLARAVAIAASTFVNGGVQPRSGEAYSVQCQAIEDLDTTEMKGETVGALRRLLYAQNVASMSSADMYGATLGFRQVLDQKESKDV